GWHRLQVTLMLRVPDIIAMLGLPQQARSSGNLVYSVRWSRRVGIEDVGVASGDYVPHEKRECENRQRAARPEPSARWYVGCLVLFLRTTPHGESVPNPPS